RARDCDQSWRGGRGESVVVRSLWTLARVPSLQPGRIPCHGDGLCQPLPDSAERRRARARSARVGDDARRTLWPRRLAIRAGLGRPAGGQTHGTMSAHLRHIFPLGWCSPGGLFFSLDGSAMSEAERLSGLIGEIYDAALDPPLWPKVLAKSARFVEGFSAALVFKDATRKSGNLYYDTGDIEPHYKQLYFENYVRLDPSTTSHVLAEIGEPVATADIMPYDEFLETRFYKEWARPQQLVDFVTAVLEKSSTGAALFGVFRHERNGPADDEMRRRMRLIIPHIRRA